MTNEIVHYESSVDWTTGSPVVKYKAMLTKEVLAELPLVAISMPYKRTEGEILLGEGLEFEGKTNAEVMNIRMARSAARGDREAIKMLQDRILGKPKQQIETHKISENYHEFVERVTKEENEIQEANAHVL
jgi:hypothetical protein